MLMLTAVAPDSSMVMVARRVSGRQMFLLQLLLSWADSIETRTIQGSDCEKHWEKKSYISQVFLLKSAAAAKFPFLPEIGIRLVLQN